jgi:hypothetical protein
MQTPVPHVDPQSDPHDDIVAILRSDSAPRTAHDPSGLHVDLSDRIAPARPIPMPELGPPASALNDNRTLPRKRGGGFMRFVLTVCVGIAATVAYQAYGDTAREKLMAMAPELLGSSPVHAEDANATDQQTPPQTQAAAEAAPAQPAPAAETAAVPATTAAAPQAAPPQGASSPDLAPLIEGMSREIASLRESIEQLKANQHQMSRDLAKAAEEPKEAKPRKQAKAAPPPPPPTPTARPVTERFPPQPARQYAPPQQQQVYIPPPPPPPQSLGESIYAPRPPRPLP